ncbi:hypothetical protein [Dethiothermospora halolimnae]|uniref:hypothetical protein n=1 Tax=Dethiothermospora halolimnae TaxID=3114390 RepID=UPI003CCBAE00
MKKVFIFITLLVFILSGCSEEDNEKELTSNNLVEEAIEQNEREDKNEVTIAIWEDDYRYYTEEFEMLNYEINKIEKEAGIKVKYDIIEGETQEEFFKKLNTKLYLDRGPTLIYLCETPIKIYTDSGVALKLKGKVENLDKIYDSIKDRDDYFVPIGMKTHSLLITREEFDYLGIKEPKYDWSWSDYTSIRDKWIDKNEVKLRRHFIKDIYDYKINQLDIIDMENKKANINTEEMKKCIKDLRSEFLGGKYILPKNFKQKDYYNAYFTTESVKRQKDTDYKSFIKYHPDYIFSELIETELHAFVVDKRMKENKIVVSNVMNEDKNVSLGGFLVNRNGENIELGTKLINYLLSDDMQMRLYNSSRKPFMLSFYPVNKDIEEKIRVLEKNQKLSQEALELKEYLLEKIKSGENKPKLTYEDQNMSIYILKDKLYKDIFKLVFADEEYNDSKLERKLQELENQYNIYLNE